MEQIIEVHDFMRAQLTARFGEEVGGAISLLYGGSVKPSNAAEIFGVENVRAKESKDADDDDEGVDEDDEDKEEEDDEVDRKNEEEE